MKYKLSKAFAVVLFCYMVLFGSSISEAGTFEEIYMTNAYGSYDSVEVFGWEEQPWLYLKIPDSQSGKSINIKWAWWHDPDDNIIYEGGANPSMEKESWYSLTDWDSVKTHGAWKAEAAYYYPGRETGTGETNFTVTPEPVSSVLFLLGGMSLFGFEYKKRKNFRA